MADDEMKWRNRLLMVTMARLGGLIIAGFGLAIVYTDLLREGGWPQVGAILVILGTLDAVFTPMVMKRAWDREDGTGR